MTEQSIIRFVGVVHAAVLWPFALVGVFLPVIAAVQLIAWQYLSAQILKSII